LSGEDPGFDPSAISESDVEKRRILEENMRRQIDKKMREQGKAKEEFSSADSYADPILTLLRDLDDDIGNLSDEFGRVQAQLKRLETKVDKLLESKSEQNDI
jgi:archaellum component FlaC